MEVRIALCLKALSAKYHLSQITTAEDLEAETMNSRGNVLRYGDYVLFVGYRYYPDQRCFYAAIYRFGTEHHRCDTEISLLEASEKQFEDNGHAFEWAVNRVKKRKDLKI